MKKLISLIVIFVIVGSLSSCNSNSKAKTWNEEQQKKWKKDCIKLLTDNGVEKLDAEDFCDCMYKKTSEKFTPEEAENITTEQERAIWNECDYSW